MGKGSREVLEGIAAAISSFVPMYQRGQLMQQQKTRRGKAEERAADRERREQARFEMSQGANRRAATRFEERGGVAKKDTKLQGLDLMAADANHPGGAMGLVDDRIRAIKEKVAGLDQPTGEFDIAGGMSPADMMKARASADRELRALFETKAKLMRRSQQPIQGGIQGELVTEEEDAIGPPTMGGAQQGVDGPGQFWGQDFTQDIMDQKAKAAGNYPDQGGRDPHEQQRKINVAMAFQDINNPNLTVIEQLRAWAILESFGVKVPQEIKLQMEQNPDMFRGTEQSREGAGQPQSLSDQLGGLQQTPVGTPAGHPDVQPVGHRGHDHQHR